MSPNQIHPDNADDVLTDDYLTDQEVAALIRVDVDRLRRWRQKGFGPPFVLFPGNNRRYPKRLLIKWIADNTHDPTATVTQEVNAS